MPDNTDNTEIAVHEDPPSTFDSPQEIQRKVFETDSLEKANEYIYNAVLSCQEHKLPVEYTFDTDKELPDDYRLAVVPVTETIEGRGRVIVGIRVVALPSVQSVLSDATGATWAVKKLTDAMLQTVKASADKSEGLSNLPFSIADFVSTGRVSEFAGFNEVAGEYVKALKKKSASLSFVSKVLLRQILASAEFAHRQFPRIAQNNWEFIIESMIQSARAAGEEPGILAFWLKTRAETADETASVDLHDLDKLVSEELDKQAAKAEKVASAARNVANTAADASNTSNTSNQGQ